VRVAVMMEEVGPQRLVTAPATCVVRDGPLARWGLPRRSWLLCCLLQGGHAWHLRPKRSRRSELLPLSLQETLARDELQPLRQPAAPLPPPRGSLPVYRGETPRLQLPWTTKQIPPVQKKSGSTYARATPPSSLASALKADRCTRAASPCCTPQTCRSPP